MSADTHVRSESLGPHMQVSENAAGNASFYRYDSGETYTALQALFMDYAPLETQGKWSRFW